jgi:hypothetical protein
LLGDDLREKCHDLFEAMIEKGAFSSDRVTHDRKENFQRDKPYS